MYLIKSPGKKSRRYINCPIVNIRAQQASQGSQLGWLRLRGRLDSLISPLDYPVETVPLLVDRLNKVV